MQALQVLCVFLLQFIVANIATPVINSHIATRGLSQPTCANSPNTIAGTLLTRRTINPGNLRSRAPGDTILWCAQNSRTYIIFTVAYAVNTNGVFHILDGVYGLCAGMIRQYGDHLIAGGAFYWAGPDGLEMRVHNVNNHQTTYGVLGAAVSALGHYMGLNGYAAGFFSIYDGEHLVGQGMIGPGAG